MKATPFLSFVPLFCAFLHWQMLPAQNTGTPALPDSIFKRELDVLIGSGNDSLRSGKYDAALELAFKAMDLIAQKFPENHEDYLPALLLIGSTYNQNGRYSDAIRSLEKALNIANIHFGDKSHHTSAVLSELGHAYLYAGLFDKAVSSLEKSLVIQQHESPPDQHGIARNCMALGSHRKTLRKYDEALAYFKQALDIWMKIYGDTHGNIAYCYTEISQVYILLNDHAKALDYLLRADEIMKKNGDDQHPDYGYVCNDLGKAYFAEGNYPEAIRWQQKSLALFRSASKTENTLIATVLLYLGRAQLANGEYRAAIESFQADKNILTNLFASDYPGLYYTDAAIANAYRKWYWVKGADSLLEKSRAHYRLAEKGIGRAIREEASSDAQKKVLAEAIPVFEKAIGLELLFYKKNQNPAALETAWQLSEAMHGFLLLATTQEAQARNFAGIPHTELSRDSMLRVEITALEKKRKRLLETGIQLTNSLVLAQNEQIFEKKKSHEQLRISFEKNYPDYFRLKYDLRSSSLAETEQMLSTQQTLLEYFTGDSSIFVFVVQNKGSRVLEMPRDFPLNDWIQHFRGGISGYHAASKKTQGLYEETVRQFAGTAQQLYQKLLAPIAESLTSEIIVVPGDGFANLPFEALLSDTPKDLSNFNTYPFLLRKHTIQYAYSATMLHQMVERQHPQPPKGDLMAFAPFYEEDTARLAMLLQRGEVTWMGFSPLPFSGEEVFRAKKRWAHTSELRIGKDATKQAFQELAARYKILHLATHGKANHRAGEFSFLAFASKDENIENGLLSVGELYNLRLNADLVILSACETGIGEQQRGEGVLSLARAFAFAGAKSIVASLWSVNDKSTMQIMDHFYAGIKSGMPKNTALAVAKRQYLEEHPGRPAHPFFWAGFVGVGDISPIKN